jgi:hypothetical protein
MNRFCRALSLAVSLLFAAGVQRAAAQEPIPYEPEYYEVSAAVVTPHVAWAKPNAAGPVRLLVIAPWSCHRHTVELQQRLEASVTVAFTAVRSSLGYDRQTIPSYAWVKGLFTDEIAASLREKLRCDVDVIVLGTDWKTLPLWAVYEILQKVEAGTGLVIGYRQNAEYLDRLMALGSAEDSSQVLSGLDLDGVANLAGFGAQNPLFRTSSLGQGRVVQLQYAISGGANEYLTPPESTPASRQDYETYQSIAIRSILWAARREPQVRVVDLAPRTWPLVSPPPTLALTLTAAETIWRGRVEIDWCDAAGRSLATTTMSTRIAAGESALNLPTPELPAGAVFANLRVLRDQAVAGWGCLRLQTTTEPAVTEIALAKELFAGTDPLTFQMKLSAPLAAGRWRLAVSDALGRTLLTTEVPHPANSATLDQALALPPPLCVLHELTATLSVGERPTPVLVARREFCREWRRPADEFTLLTWYGPSREGYMDALTNQAFAAAGVHTVYPSHVWGKNADRRCIESLRAGLTILPYVCSVSPDAAAAKGDPHARQPAVTDPEYLRGVRDQVTDCARQFRRLCPAGYSLGDENYFSPGPEFCTAPSSLAYYRTWLKQRYGDVATLNQAWGTTLASFDAAQPVLLADARRAGNPAPWIDFRLCMEDSWTGIFAELSRAIREVDPPALVGHEGSGSLDSTGAFDWWSMLRDLQLFVPYPGAPVQGNLVRSLRNPGTLSSYWYGAYTFSCGGRRLTTQEYFPWYCLFQTFNSAWYFNSVGNAGMAHEVGFAADLRPLPHFVATAAACREIRTGFDKLLLNSDRQADGIAIYYSPLAIHETSFRGRPVSQAATLDAWCKLLNDLALQYDFVAPAQARAGLLDQGRYRLLILPLVQAMSKAEGDAIRRFVTKGGALLADLPPAIADEHGHAHAAQPLAELFGTQPGPEQLQVVTRDLAKTPVSANLPAGKPMTLSGELRTGNAAKAGFTAWANLADTPLLLKAEGKPVLLLNLVLDGYVKGRREAPGAAWRQLVAGLLAELGVKPALAVTGPDGAALDEVQVFRFQREGATFVGIMPEDFNATTVRERPAQLRLPEATHVYDLRRRGYLGRNDTIPIALRTCRAEVYGLLPHVVGKLTLAATVTAGGPARTLTCTGRLETVEGKPVGNQHVVLLDLRDPAGVVQTAYRRPVLTANGAVQASWPLAASDPAGQWSVEAVDIVSGVQSRAWVTVAGGARE